MRVAAVAALLAGGLIAACTEPREAVAEAGPGVAAAEARADARQDPPPDWPSWGRRSHVIVPELLAAEIDRDPSAASLVEALGASSSEVRDAAAWSLARIGGPGAARRFIEAIERAEATLTPATLAAIAALEPPAGALSDATAPEAPWGTLEDALWSRYAATEAADEASALLLAIARVGGPRTQIRFAADLAVLPEAGDEPRWRAAAEAVGIACARGLPIGRAGLEAIVDGLTDARAEVRVGAAYALSRCAAPSAEHLAGAERKMVVERVSSALVRDDVDPEEQRLLWRSLAALGEVPSIVPASILGSTPPPWMIEVEAVGALASHADGRLELTRRLSALPVEAFADGPRIHGVLASLRSLRSAVDGMPELVEQLEPLATRIASALASASTAGRQRVRLGWAACEIEVLRAIVRGDVAGLSACTEHLPDAPATLADTLAIEALVHMGGALPARARAEALLQRAVDPRPPVAEAALSALADVEDPRVAPTLRAALEHADVGILAAATGSIAARAMDRSRRDVQAADALLAMLARVDNGTGIEARLLAVEALGRLGVPKPGEGSEGVPSWLEEGLVARSKESAVAIRAVARAALRPLPELVARFEAEEPSAFPGGFDERATGGVDGFLREQPRGLRVVTDEGVIEIAFDRAPAPIAQANLVALARRGYFDGLRFHRVVPGFVIQGGDPRGDGYGGPGWLVPCERSNLRYERGTVGIALAGKDTGGSQFFVTHSPQPHLDGRYPIVGRVVKGMDVVDRILPHDVMTRVEVIEADEAK